MVGPLLWQTGPGVDVVWVVAVVVVVVLIVSLFKWIIFFLCKSRKKTWKNSSKKIFKNVITHSLLGTNLINCVWNVLTHFMSILTFVVWCWWLLINRLAIDVEWRLIKMWKLTCRCLITPTTCYRVKCLQSGDRKSFFLVLIKSANSTYPGQRDYKSRPLIVFITRSKRILVFISWVYCQNRVLK